MTDGVHQNGTVFGSGLGRDEFLYFHHILFLDFFVFLSLFMPSIQWLVLDTKRDEINKNTKNFV